MVNGQIHYGRFPIDLDSNVIVDRSDVRLLAIFPPADYDIIDSEIVPISGGSGKSNAVMVVVARRIT